MKKIIAFCFSLFCLLMSSQAQKKSDTKMKMGIGLKGGLNFANVTNASSINNSSKTGYMIGAFLAPPSSGVMGYRTEIVYSRQGYNFKTSTTSGTVDLDYIILPQLTTINIGKFASILLGGQIAFLLNAKADSSTSSSSGNNPYGPAMDYYNRIDYGFAGGLEIFPFKGLMIGARYNISLAKLHKDPSEFPNVTPSFIPDFSQVDLKNNVLQLFIGYRF